MSKGMLDAGVIVVALGLGGYESVASNPLIASLVFLFVLGTWELIKVASAILTKRGGIKSH